jgi:hypothetical protein
MNRASLVLVAALLGCGGSKSNADGSADVGSIERPADTTPVDGSGSDAAAGDAPGSCNAAAVAFPQGGALTPGTLCDELYACATDAADAARIEAASPHFACAAGAEAGSGCTAYTCAYRNPAGPSTLDANEIADVCAVTVLSPAPTLRCVVFVNAR